MCSSLYLQLIFKRQQIKEGWLVRYCLANHSKILHSYVYRCHCCRWKATELENCNHMIDWLIEWLDGVLRRIGNISVTAATICVMWSVWKLWSFPGGPYVPPSGNGLLRAKGVVVIDTGHHLTSHPMDISCNQNSFPIYEWTDSNICRYWDGWPSVVQFLSFFFW